MLNGLISQPKGPVATSVKQNITKYDLLGQYRSTEYSSYENRTEQNRTDKNITEQNRTDSFVFRRACQRFCAAVVYDQS